MSTKTFNIKSRTKYEQAVWEQNKKLDVNIFLEYFHSKKNLTLIKEFDYIRLYR